MPVGIDRYAYATISVAGTYNISNTPVILHTVNLTDTTPGTVTICDGNAATVALIVAGALASFRFDTELGQGLKVVTNGNTKVSIAYSKI